MDPIETGRHWNEIADLWTDLARGGYDFYRDGLNTPAFLEMLPEARLGVGTTGFLLLSKQ